MSILDRYIAASSVAPPALSVQKLRCRCDRLATVDDAVLPFSRIWLTDGRVGQIFSASVNLRCQVIIENECAENPIMKRRAFCRSALATAFTASLPIDRVLAQAAKIVDDVPVLTRGGRETMIEKAAIKELRDSMRGELLLPGNVGYEDARKIWNGMFDRRPALIARCFLPSDVRDAVDFARSNDLLVAVRSGGHSISGKSVCDGGMMIDLAPMRGVRVDPIDRTARAQAGAHLGHLDHEAQAFGLTTTTGTVSHTGCAGLTLGGGLGRLGRVYGLTCDNLLSADVVTADGQLLTCSADQNEDLFWGLRGGGGNFGIVTSFKYQLHPVGPEVLGGSLLYPLDQAKDVLNFYGEFSLNAPRELNLAAVIIQPPGGKGMIIFGATWLGSDAEGERVLRQLQDFGKPMVDNIGKHSYLELQTDNDRALPHGNNYYMKAGFLKAVEPGIIDALVDGVEPSNVRSFVTIMSQLGGAIADVGMADTAFSHRDAAYDMLIGANWTDDDQSEQQVQDMRDYWKTLAPYTHGFYINNAMDENVDGVRLTFRDNYDRLVELKNRYDPKNLFHLNTNIEPTV